MDISNREILSHFWEIFTEEIQSARLDLLPWTFGWVETQSRDGFTPYTEGGLVARQQILNRDLDDCYTSGPVHAALFHEMSRGEDFESLSDEEKEDIEDDWRFETAGFFKLDILYYIAGNSLNPAPEKGDVVHIDLYLTDDSYGRNSIPWLPYLGTGAKADRTTSVTAKLPLVVGVEAFHSVAEETAKNLASHYLAAFKATK